MLIKTLLTLFFFGVAAALAYYVYPSHPVLVWGLLGLCWACFRLSLRAKKLFGTTPPEQTAVPASSDSATTSTT
ncbi:MAG: hypothetical protein H7Z41_03505 [Cytophagales bacterium]|nr:hypothetical protein [Armatimonadota bacterium]